MTEERREYDEQIQELMGKLDDHKELLAEHTYVIRRNRTDLDKLFEAHNKLHSDLTDHMNKEDDTMARVEIFLRDLVGLDHMLVYAGKIAKGVGILAAVGAAVAIAWDSITHLFKGN